MKRWLADTGPLVAYLDATDPHHAEVADCMTPFLGRLVTTSAVVTEAMHLLGACANGPEEFAAFTVQAGLEVYDLCQPEDLEQAAALMKKYAGVRMDFADATLLLLAEGLGLSDILTLDRRRFAAFRTRRGRALRMVLRS